MEITVQHQCADFDTYRAARVKSLFNAESGANWAHTATLPDPQEDWRIGLIVGPSGSGKSSLGQRFFGPGAVYDLQGGWAKDWPIVDCIAPEGGFNAVTGALSAVGLGDVPAWLRPFHVLSNGEQFRAGLARLICEAPARAVVDEFTSVVDRQIARIGAQAFAKAWRRQAGRQIVLLSCHYDIIDWLRPDWVYDTREARLARDCLRRRPPIELEIRRTTGRWWRYFKPHYYLDLPHPPAAQYFVGLVDGEPVAHLAVCPLFTASAYRATRLVVMPEWQGAGIGIRFLEWVCQYHLDGHGRRNRPYPTFFHTSHPQLCAALRKRPGWVQTRARLYGDAKQRSMASVARTSKSESAMRRGAQKGQLGYGGHFRAIQAFKYVGKEVQDG
jgi:GNAT superfamily N-acetyltransferase